jgi:hypothetical protein
VKRLPFDPRHNLGSEQCGPKTQHAVKQEICGEPSNVFLIVEEYCQEQEEELAETEEKKNKHHKSPARPNSLRAYKNRLHCSIPGAIIGRWDNLAPWLGVVQLDELFRLVGNPYPIALFQSSASERSPPAADAARAANEAAYS